MSDTPRTNSCLTAILDADGFVDQSNCPERWVSHARELERELNAANAKIKLLEHTGEALANNPNAFTYDAWIKAKEAKP